MLFKIARQTVKHKWRDLLVLFIGLIIATAIFFMFSTVATNEAFLKNNTSIRSITIIFNVGQFLLGLITFIYLNFANRFLVQLRQREYGLLMMFGANKFAVSRLLFLETTLIGLVSLGFGIIFGIGFTGLAGQIIQKMLGITLTHWQSFNLPGLTVTLIYFIVVFSLNGLVNQFYIGRTNINKLLKADQKSENMPKSGWLQVLTGILGIVILGASFFALKSALTTGSVLMVLLTAVILNVIGTFLILRSSLTLILMLIAGLKSSQKGLRRFTLGQLSFRLQAFQRILTIVTLLFALALGAMTVGVGFKASTETTAENYSPNTINVIQPTTHEKQLIGKLTGVKWNHTYQYKTTKDTIVWDAKQFDQTPLAYFESTNNNQKAKINYGNVRALRINGTKDNAGYAELRSLVTSSAKNFMEITNTLEQNKFDHLNKPVAKVSVIRVTSMPDNRDVLDEILTSQQKRFPMLAQLSSGGAYANYVAANAIFGGLEFMGFFLSIAFLVMLASTLMFKILSNVATDQKRYRILSMLGATKGQRLQANMIEIAVLFAAPLVIGLVDVLYGLQSFKSLLANPYVGLPVSISIIGGFYIIYYLITVMLYQRLLTNKEK